MVIEAIATGVVGFCGGIGVAYLGSVRKVTRHCVDIEHLSQAVKVNAENHTKTLGLLTKVVDQNNLLIQKIIAK